MERQADGEHVVFCGYRRGEGALNPAVIKPATKIVDGEPQVTHWDLCRGTEVAAVVLRGKDKEIFEALPDNEWMTWAQMLQRARAPKSSLSRFTRKAIGAGLLEAMEGNVRMFRLTPQELGTKNVQTINK